MSEDPINQQVQDQKRKRISLNLSLEDEINAAPVTDTLMMPQQTATEAPVQQQVTTPKLYYAEMAERIEKKQYNRKVFIKWKRSQSSQMQAVTGALKGLTKLLDTPVNEVDFETVRNQYWSLMKSCDDYLNSHNPGSDEGQARYAMVEQIKSHIMTEMKTIDGYSMTASPEIQTEKTKWRDVLIGVPMISVNQMQNLDEQGQTSLIRKVEVGGQHFVFKKLEKVQLKGEGGADNSPWFLGAFTETCQEFSKELIDLRDEKNPKYKGMTADAKKARIAELEKSLKIAPLAQEVFSIRAMLYAKISYIGESGTIPKLERERPVLEQEVSRLEQEMAELDQEMAELEEASKKEEIEAYISFRSEVAGDTLSYEFREKEIEEKKKAVESKKEEKKKEIQKTRNLIMEISDRIKQEREKLAECEQTLNEYVDMVIAKEKIEELKAEIKAGDFHEKTREEIEKAIEDEQEKLRRYQKISPMVNQQLAKRMNSETNVAIIFQNFRVNLEDLFQQAGREADVPIVSDEEIEGLKLISETVEKKRVVADAGIGRAQIPNGEDLSVRNVATSVLAKALEIPDLVAESRIVEVNERGKIEKGLLMREVQGVTGDKLQEKYEGKTAQLTTNAIKQFMSLQIFDYICGQVDRHYNNFIMDVEEKNGKVVIKGITGIDNDLSFGSLAAQKIEEGMSDSSIKVLRDDNGQPNLMGLDKGLAERIIAIKPTYVQYLLKPFLKENEIASALDRLKSVQQFLQDEREKYNKGEQSVLIGDEEQEKWEQIRDELNQDEAFDSNTEFMRIKRERMKLKARSYIDPIMTGLERLKP